MIENDSVDSIKYACVVDGSNCENVTIPKWNGGQVTGTRKHLSGVWGSDATHVWAVGDGGTILKSDGQSWTSVQNSGTTSHLRGVWGSDATHVWAVGDGGTILKSDGQSWTSVQNLGIKSVLSGVWGSNEKNVGAVGENGLIVSAGASDRCVGETVKWKMDMDGSALKLTGQLTPIGEVEMVSAVLEYAEGTKERYEFSKVNERFVTKVPLKAGLVSVKLSLKRKQNTNEDSTLLPTFRVSARDTHSLVRIQAGVVTTNRFRSVSFVASVTPVLRAFFDQDGGPWRSRRCHLLCTVSPTMLLRLSDDSKGPIQLGLGLTVFLVRSFHLNGGFLFGTGDITTGWQAERSWFVGVGIDPALLADAKSLKF
jgi:hypothetical protein